MCLVLVSGGVFNFGSFAYWLIVCWFLVLWLGFMWVTLIILYGLGFCWFCACD